MLDLPRDEPVADEVERYERNIESCSQGTWAVGDPAPVIQAHEESTERSANALVDLDPGARWENGAVRGSQFATSPRLVTAVLYDPAHFAAQARGGHFYDTEVRIRNLIGLFVEGFSGGRLQVVVALRPGRLDPDAPAVTAEAAFLRTVTLVR
jgi:hypothetical protein